MAFINLSQAQQMLGLGEDIHEIVLRFAEGYNGRDKTLPIWSRFSSGDNEAVSWTVILPEIEAAFELSQFATFFIGLILCFCLGLAAPLHPKTITLIHSNDIHGIIKPYKLKPPFTMEVTFTDEEIAERSSWIPGAKRSGDRSVSFTSNDFMEVLKFFRFAR